MQEVVTHCSTEAENIATSYDMQEETYLTKTYKGDGWENKAVMSLCDNLSAMRVPRIPRNPVFCGRSKHIGRKFFYNMEKVVQNVVKLCFTSLQLKLW